MDVKCTAYQYLTLIACRTHVILTYYMYTITVCKINHIVLWKNVNTCRCVTFRHWKIFCHNSTSVLILEIVLVFLQNDPSQWRGWSVFQKTIRLWCANGGTFNLDTKDLLIGHTMQGELISGSLLGINGILSIDVDVQQKEDVMGYSAPMITCPMTVRPRLTCPWTIQPGKV